MIEIETEVGITTYITQGETETKGEDLFIWKGKMKRKSEKRESMPCLGLG